MQIARGLRFLAHDLHRLHHVALLIVERLSQTRSPRQIFRHVVEHIRKLSERFHAGVPGLIVDRIAQRRTGEIFILRYPIIRDRHLIGKRRGRQNLRHQIIGIERDWRYQRIKLVSAQRRSHRRARGRTVRPIRRPLRGIVSPLRARIVRRRGIRLRLRRILILKRPRRPARNPQHQRRHPNHRNPVSSNRIRNHHFSLPIHPPLGAPVPIVRASWVQT